MSTLALIIPSFQRVDQLALCLKSAREQHRPFDEIIVVARRNDTDTLRYLERVTALAVVVDAPGVLAAMAAGVAASSSDIVAFTDDDARITPGWSTRVLELFALPEHRDVGAVGGRDLLYDGDVQRETTLTEHVGEIRWTGRVIGNHHRGTGAGRDVRMLKGVNGAYRREALGIPTSLRGSGAQAHFEVAVGRFLRDSGWRLRYYPDLLVQHYPARRHGEDQRDAPSDDAVGDSAFNLMRALAPRYQNRRWLYVHIVGDRACPGLARCAIAVLAHDRATLARRRPAWRATTEAWRRRHEVETFLTFT